jgi:type VI secretion system protein ImpC
MSGDAERTETTTTTPEADAGLFQQFARSAGFAPKEDQLPATREFVGEFGQMLQGWLADQDRGGTVPHRPHAVLSALLREVDDRLSAQVNEVIHHEQIKKVEASWRGLNYLVRTTKPDPMIQFKVLDASKEALLEDFASAPQEDLSTLFVKVYEKLYGTFGGQPIGLMVGDYEITPATEDVSLLTSISRVAAAAHAPFLAATSPAMFGWKSFTEMEGKSSLKPVFNTHINPRYAPWDAFRKSDDSRYVGLCMPHFLLRNPYKRQEGVFQFQEEVDGTDLSSFLWGNAAYALAARVTDAFYRHRWCVSIRGPQGGGLVEGLPNYTYTTARGDEAQTCPTEIAITERRSRELSELGFVPLEHCLGTNTAAFFSTTTCQEPKLWNTDEANASAALSSRLQYIMAVSRFAHYLKVMMRDYVGDYLTRDGCENHLNRWISDYVTKDPDASKDLKRQRPLSDAVIKVEDDPARPGCYRAIAWLRPHFQLEALTASLRLVGEIPQAVRGS